MTPVGETFDSDIFVRRVRFPQPFALQLASGMQCAFHDELIQLTFENISHLLSNVIESLSHQEEMATSVVLSSATQLAWGSSVAIHFLAMLRSALQADLVNSEFASSPFVALCSALQHLTQLLHLLTADQAKTHQVSFTNFLRSMLHLCSRDQFKSNSDAVNARCSPHDSTVSTFVQVHLAEELSQISAPIIRLTEQILIDFEDQSAFSSNPSSADEDFCLLF